MLLKHLRVLFKQKQMNPEYKKKDRSLLLHCKYRTIMNLDKPHSPNVYLKHQGERKNFLRPTNHIHNISEGVIEIDLEGNIVFINKKLQQLSGYTYGEILGNSSWNFLDDDSADLLKKIIKDRKKGLSGNYEMRLRNKKGDYRRFIVKGTPVTDDNSEVTGSIATFTDITDSHFIKDYYSKQDSAMREILSSVQVAFWIYSITRKKIEYLSPAFAKLYEADINDIYASNSLKKYIYPEDYTKVIKKGRKNLFKGEYDIQYRIVTPGGGIKWVHDSAVIVKDTKGKALKIIGYAQDITKMKRAEMKLTEAEKEKDSILRAIPDSLLILDREGIIVKSYIKRNDVELLKPKVKFLENKSYTQVLSGSVLKCTEETIEGFLINDVKAFSIELEVGSKKSERWYEMKLKTVSENRMVMVFKDITSAKTTILRIQKLFNITERTKELIVITSTSGKVEYVNPEFEKVTGYNQQEIINQSLSILRSGKHRSAFYKKMWLTLLNKKTFSNIFINKKKSGAFFAEEKIITPFVDVNGKVTHFISSGRDVTKTHLDANGNVIKKGRTKADALQSSGTMSLIRKQEMERQNFASEIHEGLGQHLSATLMSLESIDFEGPLNEKEKKKIDTVNLSLNDIIKQLRGLSSNLSPSGLHKFGLYETVNQMVTKLNAQNRSTQFVLVSNISKLRFSNEIEINYYRILQESLNNVLAHSNATLCEIKLWFTTREGLKVIVLDNGKGITATELKEEKRKKLGLLNIEERAKSMNSKLSILTDKGMGFKLILISKTKIKK
jgi:PAS domain S-box-containing protein